MIQHEQFQQERLDDLGLLSGVAEVTRLVAVPLPYDNGQILFKLRWLVTLIICGNAV